MTHPIDPATPLTQEQFGPYVVFERLGVGGMATVHRAKQRGIEGIERIVALKRLLPHLAEDATFIKSFVREAKLALMLQHANVVQLFELGKVGNVYFIAMEYIDGRDIRRILRQARKASGPPTINVTLSLLIQACEALEYAHTKTTDDGEPLGLVHRDVSPSNLMVTRSGHVKVIDFGIAKAQSAQLRTQTGRVKGKLAYMAPEAIAGRELDSRSDLFSLGVIAHELLTARPLFASKNEYQTLINVQKSDILPPSAFNQAVPPELDAIVLKALARDPDERYLSAAQLRDDLHAVRIRYQLSATNREVQAWSDWAFSLEAAGGNFSGPAVTDSLAGVSLSQAVPKTPTHTLVPLRAPFEPARPGSAAERPSSPALRAPSPALRPPSLPGLRPPSSSDATVVGRARTGGLAVPAVAARAATQPPVGARTGSHPAVTALGEEEEAADVAWGGGLEHDTGAPVIIDDVPDYAHHPAAIAPYDPASAGGSAGAENVAAFDGSDDRASATLIGMMAPTPSARPASFPHGSSPDAVPTRRNTLRTASVPPPHPGLDAAELDAPGHYPDGHDATHRNERVSSPQFGASIVGAKPSGGGNAWKIALGLAAVAAVAAAIYVVAVRGDQATPAPAKPEITAATPGTLKFIVEPAGATIKIAGLDAHPGAPWTVQLDPGVVQVKISHDQFQSWETSVELSSSETQTIRVVLAPALAGADANLATLVLDSEPQGLTVLLDGKELPDKTPIKITVEPGSHGIALRQSGEILWRQTFTAEPRTQYEFSPSMSEVKRREREQREEREARDARAAVAAAAAQDIRAAMRTRPAAGSAASTPGAATGSAVTGSAGSGSALIGSAASGSALIGSAGSGSATIGSGSAAPGGSVPGGVAPGRVTPAIGATVPGAGSAVGSGARPGSGVGSVAVSPPTAGSASPGAGSAAIAPPIKPPVTPTATVAPRTGPPIVVPPNAVKRTSGAMPAISTITRPGQSVPPSITAKICIDAGGAVTSVGILKLTGDLASKLAAGMKGWRYTPHKVDGKAVPACFINIFALK